jgi:hypothetical protein
MPEPKIMTFQLLGDRGVFDRYGVPSAWLPYRKEL